MKRFFQHLYDARVWIISQFILTAFFIFLAWLAYPETFTVLILVMVLMSGLLLLVYSWQSQSWKTSNIWLALCPKAIAN